LVKRRKGLEPVKHKQKARCPFTSKKTIFKKKEKGEGSIFPRVRGKGTQDPRKSRGGKARRGEEKKGKKASLTSLIKGGKNQKKKGGGKRKAELFMVTRLGEELGGKKWGE